ncbi:hypothetical protein SGGMMB4_02603 [Sodalis glossinidius str. 'morsitans']|uniref:Hypothetical phage protein n=1 Tax=Sodalis glossinidius (strain morsitans) TaxID=343509 RepID=Q2NTU3_SODGM|nr:hypothetical protein [Sodalis glossinidius]BAE74432.1 hypothetical phage protein [Sodalis glossinidius str. 'morsitans']CRL45082.1 hypothetical protein SGGMMB4_02603 [Sodalis glossinidius str. 'morsitans']
MGQVAFDTLQALEELETAGISREQARAISLVVRKSHEVADVATKADIAEVNRNVADVRKDLSAEIADVRKDIAHRFEKTEAQISDVRKDMQLVRKDLQLEMAGIRSEQKLMRWMLGFGVIGILSLVVKAFVMPVL